MAASGERLVTAPRDMKWLRSITAATVTRADTAELLGIDQRTVTRAIEDGQLPSIRIGRRVLIPTAQLLALLDKPSGTAA